MSELKPEISTGRKFNVIWIVPLVALAIGIYMVIHTKMTEGPVITITFNTADGLEAGKTKLRFRNVDIGLVKDVTLSKSMKTVLVTVEMDREAAPLLREDTRFWVVRARVGGGAISGLGTLLSGAYIHLDPGTNGADKKREYIGLESPPLTPADAPGVRLVLHSESAGSVGTGDAILYNGYKVGRIESVTFDSDNKEVRYDAFIDSPYDDLVTTSSRFWDISGVSVDASAAGISVSTGSLDTILFGGVAFGPLPGLPPGNKAASGAVYKLNSSYHDLEADPFNYGVYFVAKFTQSMRGLEPGAPVEYRGIQVGSVERILMKELVSDREAGYGQAIPVLLYLEPGRLGAGDSEEATGYLKEGIMRGIDAGMRASLETGSLLTGKLYVNIDFYKDAEPVPLEQFDGYTVIPSIPTGLGRLEYQVSSLLEKFNALPLDDTVTGVNITLSKLTATLESLHEILAQDDTRELSAELGETLVELRKTLGGLSPDSPVGQSISNSLFELNKTLQNVEELTRTLSDKPNALVFPANIPADPIPEARP